MVSDQEFGIHNASSRNRTRLIESFSSQSAGATIGKPWNQKIRFHPLPIRYLADIAIAFAD